MANKQAIRDKVSVVGVGCCQFRENWDQSPADMIVDAAYEAYADAGIENPVTALEAPSVAADTVDPRVKLGESHVNAMIGLEELGMTPMELLKSATSNIAKAYKLDALIGTLEKGKLADVVILDANPLEGARNYRRVNMVIKDGKVVDIGALPLAPIISAKAPGR